MLLLLTKTSLIQWISLVTIYSSLIYRTNHEMYTSIDANLIDPYLDIQPRPVSPKISPLIKSLNQTAKERWSSSLLYTCPFS